MPERKSKPLSIYEILIDLPSAFLLFQPNYFVNLPQEEQVQILEICGVDPDSPNALKEAIKQVNQKYADIRKYYHLDP